MGDKDRDGEIDFKEFLNYCVEHEKKLRLVFQAMDTNKDGMGLPSKLTFELSLLTLCRCVRCGRDQRHIEAFGADFY